MSTARSGTNCYTLISQTLVPGERIELSTRGSSGHCSTTELPRRNDFVKILLSIYKKCGPEESRTPDLRSANAALYQLSYGPK